MKEAFVSLKERVIRLIEQVVALKKEVARQEKTKKELEKGFFLDLIAIIDAIEEEEKLFLKNNTELLEIHQTHTKAKAPLIALLRKYGIAKLEPPYNQIPEFFTAVRTIKASAKKEGEIVELVKNGYIREGEIIRPAHLVIVQNT